MQTVAISGQAIATPDNLSGGVWLHSTPTAYNRYTIFAIDSEHTKADFLTYLGNNGIGVKVLLGSYKGLVEDAYIINSRHVAFILGFIKGQESVLELGPQRNFGGGLLLRPAQLTYRDNRPIVDLGYFQEVGKEFAGKSDSWTYDPSTGKYWVAKQDITR